MRRIGVFSFGHLLQPGRGCGTFELLCFNSKLTKIRRDESKERRVYKSVFNEMNCYLSLMTTPFFKKKYAHLIFKQHWTVSSIKIVTFQI